jgi:hypothetical protein
MKRINNPAELPKLLESLAEQRFFGDLNLHFRNGELTKLAIEETQIFDSRERNHLNARDKR